MQYSILSSSPILFCATLAAAAPISEHLDNQGPFPTPMAVTESCLECHDEAAKEVMRSSHWTWSAKQRLGGKDVMRGKKNTLNNFCISLAGNWPRCTSCHVGYGWKDDSFDFSDASRVDCLVCHDQTGTYKKPGPAAGMPAGFTGNSELDKKPVDLRKIAQQVGKTRRENCIVCHGYGGGGNNIKHGDIDSGMITPARTHDVHMSADGEDMTCQGCHETKGHQIRGNAMVVSPGGMSPISCTNCHDAEPHGESVLNQHGGSVACQTCHIPTFARDIPTKMSWDWSQAGQDKEAPTDDLGKPTYAKKKGAFTFGKKVVPTYAWYNGTGGAYALGEKINPAKVTKLNWPLGSIRDRHAKIFPFKVHTGKQIYDTKNRIFITPKLFPAGEDKTAAYWKSFDWQKAAVAGMKASGLNYSGSFGFAPTSMHWPINHGVVPKENALGCLDCHGDKGRLDWNALGFGGDPVKKSAQRMPRRR